MSGSSPDSRDPKGRIFLVANGPSLAWTDLDRLIGEEAWGLARIHLLYHRTAWRPTRYWWSDHPQTQEDMDDILFHMDQGYDCWYRSDVCEIITGEYVPSGANADGKWVCPAPWAPDPRPLPHHVHSWEYCRDHNAGFIRNMDGSPDVRRPEGWHLDGPLCKYGSGFNCMLQQAFLEGYNPIYLVGADLGFVPRGEGDIDQNHFDQHYHHRLVEAERAAIDNDTHIDFHRHAREYCEPLGTFILNATLGGELEVYPRIDWKMLWK